ncbi:probable serine/threonine-protein kinase PBL7 isoform X1 [Jatropha curcas]|uniref:probable serine/threonine-protein kinase PBL7 isoform X1 n=1 Tax=Jatropha curcas TaxID=180498 RepID=UPI001893A1FE|nr:probable serine/threonine-protein kinase PBL7 isoform X1 [Jatropha curcas]
MITHPNLVEFVGYCYDEQQLGTVFDLDPLGSVYELAPKGCFTWLHRIKVAYEFACLKFLHIRNPPYQPCLVHNIDAAHIMLDKEYTPKLLDFGMFTGGIILDMRFDRNMYLRGCFGYMDPCLIQGGMSTEWHNVIPFDYHMAYFSALINTCM